MLKIYNQKEKTQYIKDLKKSENPYYIDIPVNRISIIGGPGSGKSTLTTILSKELNIPAIHLDSINFSANWIEIDKNKRDSIIESKAKEEKWIIDGNYNKTLKNRLDKSDLIIWLDYSSFAHIKGVLKRLIKNYNKEKPELPGCKERFNFDFIKFVISYNKKNRPVIQELLSKYSNNKILVFKNQKHLNKWLKRYTNNKDVLKNLV